MQSTFSGIEIGKKGIITHQAALGITGHNLTNAETEGYSRQKVTFQVFDPLYIPGLTRELTAGQIGQGVKIEKIMRARDLLLEDRILSEKNILAYWRSMSEWIRQVELVHNEPSGYGVLNALDRFWASWQELANNPEEIAPREAVRESGEALSESINHLYMALKSIRDNIEQTIAVKVEEVNSLAQQIAKLNKEILRSESSGDNPNDLWDRRDLLVEKLSKLVNISVSRSDSDEFIVYIGGKHLVQGKHFQKLLLVKNPQNEGYSDILWDDGGVVDIRSGELKALLDARDIEIKSQIHDLDVLAVTVTDAVNSIHRRGFGLNLKTGIDFFTEKSIAIDRNGNYDSNGDGFIDGTAIFRISGTKKLSLDDVVGLTGTIILGNGVTVRYTPTDTVEDVVKKVNNAGTDIRMYVNSDGRLVVKSYSENFMIEHLEDSGDFLVQFSGILNQSGPQGAFDRGNAGMSAVLAGDFMVAPSPHPSSWIGVNEVLKNEVESIAASTGTDTDGDGIPDLSSGAGNGDNALKIANVRFDHIMVGGKTTINEFYQGIISKTGLKGETAGNAEKNLSMIVENLENLRKSISGVSIDEELVNLVKFQHGYAAAARFITEVNKMLDLLINRMI